MAPLRGSAAYKKKDGTLMLSKDSQTVTWTSVAPPGSKPTLIVLLPTITNLQATPPTNLKVMLKIFALAPGASTSETHIFTFTSPTAARTEADSIKDALTKAIQLAKSGNDMLAAAGSSAASAAMAIASAVSSKPGGGGDMHAWYDNGRLKTDVELHQSLLKADPSLSKTFFESLRTKPDAITSSQFTLQFWSARVHLLRAHAIEKNQMRGAYNVLSSVKPTTVDGTLRLSVSKEQIQLIFNQHSLVKRVYDESVPQLSEEAFWKRFFQSRLFKKLKGEFISESDPTDPILDRYLQHDDDTERAQRLLASHVPHIIDIEGNEENHSQRKGNQPDLTMRPTSVDKVPIMRRLNAISENIMSHVTPNDIDPSLPIGVDEETYNALALQDLQGDAEENRVILNIRDQSRFFSEDKENGISADAIRYAKQDPVQVLHSLQADLATAADPDLNLETTIGVDNDSSSSDSDAEAPPKKSHVGSNSSRAAATVQILAAIAEQRAQSDDLSLSSSGFSTISQTPTVFSGLSIAIFDRLSLTHATTTEFLQHFWSAFLSGDGARAEEVFNLAESLKRSIERITAVADDAEKERMKEIEKLRRQVRDHYERTQRKLKVDLDSVGGGAKVVNQLLAPTVKAIEIAQKEYKKAVVTEGGETA